MFSTIKSTIYQLCLALVKQRIENAQIALSQAQEAANDDTKSSAGDKFETTREMMQQEIDRNKKLLYDSQQNLHLLQQCENSPVSDSVKTGSLVYTSSGVFYISISIGQVKADEINVFAISAVSPIGKLLMGKREGNKFKFNNQDYLIKSVQ